MAPKDGGEGEGWGEMKMEKMGGRRRTGGEEGREAWGIWEGGGVEEKDYVPAHPNSKRELYMLASVVHDLGIIGPDFEEIPDRMR